MVRDVVVGAMIENFDGEAEFLKSWSKNNFLVAEKRLVRSWRIVRGANFSPPQSFQEIFGSGAKNAAREKGEMDIFLI